MPKEAQVPSQPVAPTQTATGSWEGGDGQMGPCPLCATLLLAQLATVGTGREQGRACSQPGCLDGSDQFTRERAGHTCAPEVKGSSGHPDPEPHMRHQSG